MYKEFSHAWSISMLFNQKIKEKMFTWEKSSIPVGLAGGINMSAALLLRDTNKPTATPREKNSIDKLNTRKNKSMGSLWKS